MQGVASNRHSLYVTDSRLIGQHLARIHNCLDATGRYGLDRTCPAALPALEIRVNKSSDDAAGGSKDAPAAG